jgi:ABC-type dipeptide/oligopeptide/nickel transport system permease component
MIFYIIRRLIAAIPTLLAVLTLVFLIVRVVPGDPAIAILGDRATPEGVAALDAKLGLDKPIWRQYVDFLGQSLSGDFGNSMVTGRPIVSDVGAVLPHTIDLTLASLLVGSIIGVPAGIWASLHRNRSPAVADRPVVSSVRLRHLHPVGLRAALAAVPGDR